MNKSMDFANRALHIIGLLFCILPPALATLCYFPVWKMQGSGYTVAGGCILLGVLCLMPLYKHLKRLLASPSSYVMWLMIFILFFVASKIADEMTVIAFVGFLGNLLGGIAFRIRKRLKEEKSDE